MVFIKEELRGVFPLVYTGKIWVSLPHFSYGGILFQDEEVVVNFVHIIDEIIPKLTDLKPGFYRFNIDNENKCTNKFTKKIFIRSISQIGSNRFVKSEKVTSVLSLTEGKDELWSLLNQNLRRKINKTRQYETKVVTGGLELLDDFYNVYTQNIVQLGSIVYAKSFFKDLLNSWERGIIKLFVIYKDNMPIAGSLLASYNGYYENVFFATLKKFRKEYISDLLHWEMIKFCITNISESTSDFQSTPVYSFGRSTQDSGVFKYKNHWPVNNYPLYNYTNIPNLRKNNLMLNIWRLLPGFITKPLGAKLIRHIY